MIDDQGARYGQLNPRCRRLLEEAGFAWHSDTGMWINNRIGRAISHHTVRDHTPEWLQNWLHEIGQD